MSDLFLPPKPPLPEVPDAQWIAFSKWLFGYELQRASFLESVLLDNSVSPFRVPDTTIDLGSGVITFSSGAKAAAAFSVALLPNTYTTTSNVFGTAFSHTGKGVLQSVYAVSQVAGGASTAAGMSVQITIDGNVVYTGAVLSAVNKGIAVVGEACIADATNEYYNVLPDPIGLTYQQTCLVEFKSGTNGQGVSLGVKDLKLH